MFKYALMFLFIYDLFLNALLYFRYLTVAQPILNKPALLLTVLDNHLFSRSAYL